MSRLKSHHLNMRTVDHDRSRTSEVRTEPFDDRKWLVFARNNEATGCMSTQHTSGLLLTYPSNSPANSSSLVLLRFPTTIFRLLYRLFCLSDLKTPVSGSDGATTERRKMELPEHASIVPTRCVIFIRCSPIEWGECRIHHAFVKVHVIHNCIRRRWFNIADCE